MKFFYLVLSNLENNLVARAGVALCHRHGIGRLIRSSQSTLGREMRHGIPPSRHFWIVVTVMISCLGDLTQCDFETRWRVNALLSRASLGSRALARSCGLSNPWASGEQSPRSSWGFCDRGRRGVGRWNKQPKVGGSHILHVILHPLNIWHVLIHLTL